ncbi:MAG: tRNA (adenosine(37)-N6)-threonylcarbamoyltransferase complex ATPase subunit type 1 TsaE [Gammaproteobacteria bacterium]
MIRDVASAGDMEALGGQMAGRCRPGMRLHLQGELGAGKTTLVRGFLRGLGYRGRVKSPTYTLVEPYHIENKTVYHFDLYRISDPEEVEAIGLRDYLDGVSLCLIEWPERAQGLLGEADLTVSIEIRDQGRRVNLIPGSLEGRALVRSLRESDLA